eukprot:TRINITY_DN4861_c0_g1_i2.p1 TRINITY_DN4861_c0_g1~~TRINITY_DN4861_c0_g1_i2.p1  ORF type:complete len:239 (-),score=45.24 TRINITY_DN4861_c0_g1_i2:488-1204(-)
MSSLASLAPFVKPTGCTSMRVLAIIKRLIRPLMRPGSKPKVGHGGTLDPLANGVLVVGVGKGCKLLGTQLKKDKAYEATGMLGFETDTLDSEGKPTDHAEWAHVDREAIAGVLPQFRGQIQQVPPMFSALHQNGRRLYELAREGIVVDRPPREVVVRRLELVGNRSLPEFELSVECSGGTYVRTLVADVGRAVGSRAHMTALTRTRAGEFELGECLELTDESTTEQVLEHLQRHAVKF